MELEMKKKAFQTEVCIEIFFLPEFFSVLNLDEVPLCAPLLVQELGHVVPDGVREDHDTLLPGLQTLGDVASDGHGSTAATT